MIHSPRVPVFRDDAGALLETPYRVSMLTVPAVNAGAVRRNEPQNVPLIRPTMERRAARLLDVAVRHGHRTLVLGAWGCGVFANEPGRVAEIFARLLAGEYASAFARVTFAVYDPGGAGHVLAAFRRSFEV